MALRHCSRLKKILKTNTVSKPENFMGNKSLNLMAAFAAAAVVLSANLSTAQTSDSKSQASSSSPTAGLHASKLIGADVQSSTGQKYGKLEDIIIDPQTGKATFAIVGKGGILRLGEKRLPVPWQALSLSSEKRVTLNMDPQKLQSAPTIETGSAELDNPDFVVVVYKFYEIPVSSSGAAGETPGGSQTGSSSSRTNSGSSQP